MKLKSVKKSETSGNPENKCRDCGAVNAAGAQNCMFCGRTLVNAYTEETEESMMSLDEILRSIVGGRDEFLHSTAEAVKEINQKRNPDYKKENGKRNFYIGLVIAIVLLFFVLGMIMSFLQFGMFGLMRATQGMPEKNVSMFFSLMNVIQMLFGLVSFGVFVLVLFFIFKKTKTTRTVYMTKCANCGANNPVKSEVCGYCGSSLVKTTTTTENSDFTHQAAQSAKDIIVDAINASYDKKDRD